MTALFAKVALGIAVAALSVHWLTASLDETIQIPQPTQEVAP